MITENIFLPFKVTSTELFKDKKVLVLIPHQDDETFGCGGTLCKIKNITEKIDFCLITDGGKSDSSVSAELRNEELKRVADILGVKNIFSLKIPDREVFFQKEIITSQLNNIFGNYDLVFSPNPLDIHPDHRYLAHIVINIVTNIPKDISIACYEVTLPQLLINFLVDISDVIDEKMKLVSMYDSQLSLMDYDEKIILINKIRTLAINDIKYAEGFYVVHGKDEMANYLKTLKSLLNFSTGEI